MNREITLQDILQIEDSVDIAAICCPDTGIPLWTTVRCVVLRLIMGDLLYGVPISSGGAALGAGSRLRQGAMILRAFMHNNLNRNAMIRQHQVVLMATGARLVERDAKFFNGLSDYFVSAFPKDTLAIEDLFGSQWPFPRHNNKVIFQTPLRVEGVFRGRLRLEQYREPTRALVELISDRAKEILGWDLGIERRHSLERTCLHSSASLLPRYLKYLMIFKRMEARVLLKEEACYGGADNASAMIAAKDLGMVTAEYQHGAISAGHDAYNFAPTISSDPRFKKILPDYLLTYGTWWGERVNVPVEKIAIGNPHRTESVIVSLPTALHSRKILILGDGIDTTVYLDLCERLCNLLKGHFDVVFRPHPLERSGVWARNPSGFVGQASLDTHQDIFSSFRDAGVVISEVSTGLFDAIGLVPRVFIWDTPKARFSFPEHPFQRFNDADHLARLVQDETLGRVSIRDINRIWEPNWKTNYLSFIEKQLNNEPLL